MTRGSFYNLLTSMILSTVIAVGSVCSLVTGLDLQVQMGAVAMVIAVTAMAVSACCSYKWGGVIVLGSLLVVLPMFFTTDIGKEQVYALITRVSLIYDQAYHTGMISFGTPWKHVSNNLPVMALGVACASVIAWAIGRKRGVWLAVIAAVLPIVPCVFLIDTIPSTWCLFLTVCGVCVMLLTAYVRRHDPEKAHVLSGMSVLAIVLCLVLLFVAVPRDTYKNPFEYQQNKLLSFLGFPNGIVGDGNEEIEGVNLKKLGSRFILPFEVLEVTSSEGGLVYLREQDYNAYDGTMWQSSPGRTETFSMFPSTQTLSIQTRWYRHRLLVPYYPFGVSLVGGREHNVDEVLTYDWQVSSLPENWRDIVDLYEKNSGASIIDSSSDFVMMPTQLEGDDDTSNERGTTVFAETEFYTVLPEETELWAKELLSTILTTERAATAKADTVAAYVRNSALYKEDVDRMPSSEDDFVKWFISDADKGYCVHFATATAVLLRAAGVETRYVTGYAVSTEAGVPTVVTADMEHAWVEYYEPAVSQWIVLESTPAEVESDEEMVPTTTTTLPLGTDEGTVTTTTIPVDQPQSAATVDVGAVLRTVAVVLLCAAVIFAATEGQRLLRLRYRRKRWEKSSQNERALLLWRRVERSAYLLDEEEPPTLLSLAQKAKFSQHTLNDADLALFESYLAMSNETLQSQPWYQRTIYRYIFLI